MRLLWRYPTPIKAHACTSVSFFAATPTITVMRSRSCPLIVNVSMLWPGCYRNPATKGTFLSSYHGDILTEFRQCFFPPLTPRLPNPDNAAMFRHKIEEGEPGVLLYGITP